MALAYFFDADFFHLASHTKKFLMIYLFHRIRWLGLGIMSPMSCLSAGYYAISPHAYDVKMLHAWSLFLPNAAFTANADGVVWYLWLWHAVTLWYNFSTVPPFCSHFTPDFRYIWRLVFHSALTPRSRAISTTLATADTPWCWFKINFSF